MCTSAIHSKWRIQRSYFHCNHSILVDDLFLYLGLNWLLQFHINGGKNIRTRKMLIWNQMICNAISSFTLHQLSLSSDTINWNITYLGWNEIKQRRKLKSVAIDSESGKWIPCRFLLIHGSVHFNEQKYVLTSRRNYWFVQIIPLIIAVLQFHGQISNEKTNIQLNNWIQMHFVAKSFYLRSFFEKLCHQSADVVWVWTL